MIRLLICDDEIRFCEQYAKMAESILGQKASVGISTDPRAFWEELQQSGADLVLLDIDMPEMDGFEIAARMEQLPQKPILIFVTSHDVLVYDTFQYHPFGFIRKSHVERELEPVLREALEEWRRRTQRYAFRCGDERVALSLDEIIYFESKGNYVELHTEAQTYRIRETMANVDRELAAVGFVRIHKGFLVNQKAVYRIRSDEVVLRGDIVVPIGRSRKEETREKLVRYMMS